MNDSTSKAVERPRSVQGRAAAPSTSETLEAVAAALRDIEYGSVLIKIHQGEVVGIETSTKLRLKGT